MNEANLYANTKLVIST